VAEPGRQPDVLLQFGLNSAKSAAELSAPVALVVTIDRSGSMTAEGLAAVAQGIALLAEQLPPASQLGVLSFGNDVQTVWPM
jgi:Mg-chelatase subunit ChlD